MASRSTSSTQHAPPPHAQPGQSISSNIQQHRRNLLSQSLSRRPPAATSRSRSRPNLHDPTPSRASRRPMSPSIEGTDEHEEDQSSDSDIIVSRPAPLLCTSHTSHQNLLLDQHGSQDTHADTNAQAMTEAILIQRATAQGHVDKADVLPDMSFARPGVEGDGTAQLIAMYRRRERDREQVDQEELKNALWESLRRKVKSLDEDRWMFEVEDDTTIDCG